MLQVLDIALDSDSAKKREQSDGSEEQSNLEDDSDSPSVIDDGDVASNIYDIDNTWILVSQVSTSVVKRKHH